MKPIVKYALWAVVLGAVVFAGYKGYQLYKARQAAKQITA